MPIYLLIDLYVCVYIWVCVCILFLYSFIHSSHFSHTSISVQQRNLDELERQGYLWYYMTLSSNSQGHIDHRGNKSWLWGELEWDGDRGSLEYEIWGVSSKNQENWWQRQVVPFSLLPGYLFFFPTHQETCFGHYLRYPWPGGLALGAGPVPPACLGRLLLLHLEGGQDHREGEVFWLLVSSLGTLTASL